LLALRRGGTELLGLRLRRGAEGSAGLGRCEGRLRRGLRLGKRLLALRLLGLGLRGRAELLRLPLRRSGTELLTLLPALRRGRTELLALLLTLLLPLRIRSLLAVGLSSRPGEAGGRRHRLLEVRRDRRGVGDRHGNRG
jgi:hypothetical protein